MTDETTETTDTAETTPDAPDTASESTTNTSLLGQQSEAERPNWLPEKFKSGEALAESYSHLEKKLGNFTGAPDAYELPQIEGIEIDNEGELYKHISGFCKENNVNQDMFNNLVETYFSHQEVSQEVQLKAELDSLGSNASSRLASVEQYLKNTFPDDFQALAGLVTSANSVKLMERMIAANAPAKLPFEGGESASGMTEAKLQELMYAKDDNGNLKRSVDPAYNKMVQSELNKFYGEQPVQKQVG